MQIPFIDLKAQYQAIQSEIDTAIAQVVSGFSFLKGKQVSSFEEQFASLLQVNHVVSTANGTDSLLLSLKALKLDRDDEVITPAWSCIPSAEIISFSGQRPVFADVDDKYFTIDVSEVARKITTKTKAVIAVHLYGQAVAVKELRALCDSANLKLIEDCAQAHLTMVGDRMAGSWGHVSAFSFYPTKNLGAYGDAGCVATNDAGIAETVRRLANHGALMKDDHQMEGINSRMDTLQAAILLAKLPHLAAWTEKRIAHAHQYATLLADVPQITTPQIRSGCRHTFHIYAIRAVNRDALKNYLHEQGIETIIHYPKALTNLPFYKSSKEKFSVANELENEILSLPIYPELEQDQIQFICDKIRSFYKK